MHSSTPAEAPRRGRKYRPPVDPTPISATSGADQTRLAWLIGCHRLSAFDGRFSHRGDLLVELRERMPSVAWDDSGVSRWESGARIPGRDVLSAYETVLNLPHRSLHAMTDILEDTRFRVPRPRASRRLDQHLANLIEVVLDGAPDGSQWWEFADAVLEHGPLFTRTGAWDAPLGQLVQETSSSVRQEYVTRRAAIQNLLRHPSLGEPLLGSLLRSLEDPSMARHADLASLVQFAPTTSAIAALLEKLLISPDTAVRLGGWRAVAALAARGQVDEATASAIAQVAANRAHSETEVRYVAHALSLLGGDAAERARAPWENMDSVQLFLATGETVAAPIATSIASAIARLTAANGPSPLREIKDPMLERLIREALFHIHPERRAQSSTLLMMSPYAAGLSAAIAASFGDLDPQIHPQVSALLRWCLTEQEAAFAASLIRSADPRVQLHALDALSNLPDGLPDQILSAGEGSASTSPRDQIAINSALGQRSMISPTDAEER